MIDTILKRRQLGCLSLSNKGRRGLLPLVWMPCLVDVDEVDLSSVTDKTPDMLKWEAMKLINLSRKKMRTNRRQVFRSTLRKMQATNRRRLHRESHTLITFNMVTNEALYWVFFDPRFSAIMALPVVGLRCSCSFESNLTQFAVHVAWSWMNRNWEKGCETLSARRAMVMNHLNRWGGLL